MRFGSVYRHFIRNNLFVKVILTFSIIVILTIISLSYLLYNFVSASIGRSQLQDQREAMDRVNQYLEQKYNWVQNAAQEIYRSDPLADSVSYLLKHPYQEYIQYTLNNSTIGNGNASNALNYLAGKFGSDSDIRNLIVYSSEMQQLYVYQASSTPKLYRTDLTHSYIPDVMSMEATSAGTPNVWVRKTINQWDTRLYSMRVQINDKNTLKNIGQMIVYFDSEMIRQSLANYSSSLKGTILALTPDGQVMFDTSGQYYGRRYPYMDQIQSLKETADLEEPSYISTTGQNSAGYTIVGIMPKRELSAAYAGLRRTLVLFSLICIAFAVVIPSLVILNIARRTNNIVRTMRKVEGGDLSVQLQDIREDELGQISRSFNEMVKELRRRIDREYKAEIRLKQTELSALQARIHPHFLYNTLEAIRMRALSQGAADVGEMIYSLAALFRSLVRTRSDCPLSEELEMCRLYLELFRIRYKDKFTYAIDCDPYLASLKLPKLLLQPLVENCVVHGLKYERKDNLISIRAERQGNLAVIRVWNNGTAIDTDNLMRIRSALDKPETEGSSFGLRSVHERLQLLYGPEYGLELESSEVAGTTVTVRLPLEQEERGAVASHV